MLIRRLAESSGLQASAEEAAGGAGGAAKSETVISPELPESAVQQHGEGNDPSSSTFLENLMRVERENQELAARDYIRRYLFLQPPEARLKKYQDMIKQKCGDKKTGVSKGSAFLSDSGDNHTPTIDEIRSANLTFTNNDKTRSNRTLEQVTKPSFVANLNPFGVPGDTVGEFAVVNLGLILCKKQNRFPNIMAAIEFMLMLNGFLIFVVSSFMQSVDNVRDDISGLRNLQFAINIMSSLGFFGFLSAGVSAFSILVCSFTLTNSDVPFSYFLQTVQALVIPQAMTVIGFNLLVHIAMCAVIIRFEDNVELGIAIAGFMFCWFWYSVGWVLFGILRFHGPSPMALLAFHYPPWARTWMNLYWGHGDMALQAACCAAELRKSIRSEAPDLAWMLD